MDSMKVGSGLVLALLAVAGAAVAATTAGLTMDEQLLGSDLQTAAVATAVLLLGVLVLFAALGQPWKNWGRTQYW